MRNIVLVLLLGLIYGSVWAGNGDMEAGHYHFASCEMNKSSIKSSEGVLKS